MAVYWNDSLNEEFIRMRLARTPVAEMALHFGTSVAAIYAHGRVINCLVMDRQDWTLDEVEVVKRMVADGRSDKEIGAALGRDPKRLRWKLNDLGLTGARVRDWTEQEIEAIRHLGGAGSTAAEISLALKRPTEQVRQKARKINVTLQRPKRDMTPLAVARQRKKEKTPPPKLTEEQLAVVKEMTGVFSQRDIAKTLGMSLKVMIVRANAAGHIIGTSVRRHGAPLTKEVLTDLIDRGMTAREAGDHLARDPRTVIAAADALCLSFGPNHARRAADRAQAQAITRTKAREDKRAKGIKKAKITDALKTKKPHEAIQVAVKPKAERPRLKSNGRGPLVVKAVVSQAPSTKPGACAAPALPASPRRFNAGFSAGGKPRLEFAQADVDAAVARFIAERGVTRAPAADPVEATVTAARRLGYIVIKDEHGFLLDGHIRVSSADALSEFVSRRSNLRSMGIAAE